MSGNASHRKQSNFEGLAGLCAFQLNCKLKYHKRGVGHVPPSEWTLEQAVAFRKRIWTKPSNQQGMSNVQKHFVAGLLNRLIELLGFSDPDSDDVIPKYSEDEVEAEEVVKEERLFADGRYISSSQWASELVSSFQARRIDRVEAEQKLASAEATLRADIAKISAEFTAAAQKSVLLEAQLVHTIKDRDAIDMTLHTVRASARECGRDCCSRRESGLVSS
jgi:hypothetical protein